MQLNISSAFLSDRSVEHPNQTDYVHVKCPICQKEDESVLISKIQAGEKTSLESAYCRRCEHRYFRKLPSKKWYENYYQNIWLKKTELSPSKLAQFKWSLKRRPLIKDLWWRLQSFSKTRQSDLSRSNKVYDFLLGIAKTDNFFNLAFKDIKKVLEIGCGNGNMLDVFDRNGFEAYGTEISKHRAAYCRLRGLNVFDCDIDNLEPVKKFGPFDIVYSHHVLEHIVDLATHIKELSAITKKKAYLFFEFPNHNQEFFMVNIGCSHPQAFTPKSIKLLLMQHGFVPIRMLIDTNIQVLARKSDSREDGFLPEFHDPGEPERSVKFLEPIKQEKGPFKLQWNTSDVVLTRLSDQAVVYSKEKIFNHLAAGRNELEFTVVPGNNSSIFPVCFYFPNEKEPPVWIK